jgi:hypothetical protein
MTLIGKLFNPADHPRTTTHRNSFRAYSAEASRLVALARESGRRFQSQWVLLFIFVMIMLATVAGMYLNVTASAAIAGREIQSIEADITINERANADLQTNIATLLSNKVLEERVHAMGFEPVDRTELEYMVVPGYFPVQAVTMAAPPVQPDPLLSSPEFNETLIDWIKQQLETAALPLTQVNH